MIILFENFSNYEEVDFFGNDYKEVNLYKLGITLTYSTFNRQGDKEHKWRSEAIQLVKKLFTNKVVTIGDITDLVENVNAFDDVDIPLLRMKFAKDDKWIYCSLSETFKIWNEDSETAKQVRLEIEAKRYNL